MKKHIKDKQKVHAVEMDASDVSVCLGQRAEENWLLPPEDRVVY